MTDNNSFFRSNGSYWQRAATTANAHKTPPDVPRTAKIVIIGAGYAGLTTAIAIRERSPTADVVILEKKFVGFGASGRNGGLMSPLPAPIWLMSARTNADHQWATKEFNRRVNETATWLKDTIGHDEVRNQPLSLQAQGPITNTALARISKDLTTMGIEHALSATSKQLKTRTLTLAAHTVHPFKLTRDLAKYTTRLGIKICESVDVQKIEQTTNGARLTYAIHTNDGTPTPKPNSLTADTVVICTNAYTGDIENLERVNAKPVYNFMVATTPQPATNDAEKELENTFTVELNNAYAFYRAHGNRLVYGGIEKLSNRGGRDFDVPTKVLEQLKEHIKKSTPQYITASLDHAWSGKYHQTPSDLPIIRRARESSSIVFNVGYGGTGVALTMTCAQLAAAIVLKEPFQTRDDERLYDLMNATRLPLAATARFGFGCLTDILKKPFYTGSN